PAPSSRSRPLRDLHSFPTRRSSDLVGCLFLRLIHELGEPPVEEDDLAEVAEHHVLAFKVAMENPVGMSIGNGIANGGEGREQRQDRKSTRLNSSHVAISYDVRRLKK